MGAASLHPAEECFHCLAGAALALSNPDDKCAAALRLPALVGGDGGLPSNCPPAAPIGPVGRPERPLLVAPTAVPSRGLGGRAGHAALLHAIAHIEFNAINLALDCVYRFRDLPLDFHAGWAQVAAEEAQHFGMVRGRLRALGYDYGSFEAHNGLWEMACKSAHDPLVRMALVPRVLEARGLDATPPIMRKLKGIGDLDSLAVLEVILRDEVGHVALGDRWFRHFCTLRGLEPEATYEALMLQFKAPHPRPPLHVEARLRAGFSQAELDRLLQAGA